MTKKKYYSYSCRGTYGYQFIGLQQCPHSG